MRSCQVAGKLLRWKAVGVTQQLVGGFHSDMGAGGPIRLALQFGVEVVIEAARVVEEFLVGEQRHAGPHILEKEQLAPAGVAADQIGCEALFLDCLGGAGATFGADHLGFDVLHPGVQAWFIAAANAVAEVLHAGWKRFGRRFNAQAHQLVAALGGKRPQDVDVLPREALVNEQQLHSLHSC
jgi:hypothetical protein